MIDWERVRAALLSGKPILIYDFRGREEEVDMVFYAGSIDYRSIYTLRREAGGLICHAISGEAADRLGLPYLSDLMASVPGISQLSMRRLRYGDTPPYSLYINHISVRTGISDRDRATTIKKFHEVVDLALSGRVDEARKIFYSEFVSPGHVPILVSRGLNRRRGHTELSIAVASKLGLVPSMVIAEMLDEGDSMSLEKAEEYAARMGYIILRGEEILREAGPL
ncbi:MAG: 3,4-dihydroxy-2-butanone-4-phosphate synthase [Desulfurococcales archaeon]|jgi:3,4-dihydroxy 2-butanone 4-phosphate synthase|nr:3,4-dihydroxy-2-butanone-4-phosphate synthase [Desulfurococcales archaeon]